MQSEAETVRGSESTEFFETIHRLAKEVSVYIYRGRKYIFSPAVDIYGISEVLELIKRFKFPSVHALGEEVV